MEEEIRQKGELITYPVFGADGLGLVDERLGELPLVLGHRPDELRRRHRRANCSFSRSQQYDLVSRSTSNWMDGREAERRGAYAGSRRGGS